MRDGGLAVMVGNRNCKQQGKRTADDDHGPKTLLPSWGTFHRRGLSILRRERASIVFAAVV